ncbi:MAG: energy transducer TonB, partial [Pseudomonadota bacterium]
MIWASRFGKVFVVVASVGMHGLAAYLWWSEPDVQTEGGAVQARVGSFADMTAGTMSAVTPETLEEVEPTETTETATSETEVETPVDKTEAGIEPTVEQPETRPVAATPIHQSDPQPTEADAPTEDLVAPELPVEATPSETALA